jgi:hypothetical protein
MLDTTAVAPVGANVTVGAEVHPDPADVMGTNATDCALNVPDITTVPAVGVTVQPPPLNVAVGAAE